jgi:hypothetical protein
MVGKFMLILSYVALQSCGLQTKCDADQAIANAKEMLQLKTPQIKYEVTHLSFHEYFFSFVVDPSNKRKPALIVEVKKLDCKPTIANWLSPKEKG